MSFPTMGPISWKFTGQPYDLNSILTPDQVWAKLDIPAEEVRQSLITLINALNNKTASSNIGFTPNEDVDPEANTIQTAFNALVALLHGSGGAEWLKSVGVTGLTGDNVQSLLESLKTYIDNLDTTNDQALATHKLQTTNDHDGRYYTKTEVDGFAVKNTGDQTIAGVKTFSSSPIVQTPTEDMQASTKKYVDDNFTTKNEITINRKLSETGDFRGTLNGYPIVQADPGYSSMVAGINDTLNAHLAENVQQFTKLNLSKKPAFLEQFVTSFFGRGQLLNEKTLGSAVTETNITIPRPMGYGSLDIADTTPFKEGNTVIVKYDDGTYAPHFVMSVTPTVLAIRPPLLKATTTNTKVERCWYNAPHPGKFYMRYLSQRFANAKEVDNGYGENIFYANFDGSSNDDVGTAIGGSTLYYVEAVNKETNYGDVLEGAIGKVCKIVTPSIGDGTKFPTFKTKSGEHLVLKLFGMQRNSTGNIKISIVSALMCGEIASITFTGASSQIIKPYMLEFTAPYADDLCHIEITDTASSGNVIILDEIKIAHCLEVNDYILPRNGKIICFGDSWTAGDMINTSEREPYSTSLQVLLPNATIINKGVGGDTVQRLLARFDTDVVPLSPDAVIIMVGTNDVYNPSSGTFDPYAIDYYVGRLKELVQRVLEIGAKPIVVGPPALAEEDGEATNFLLNDRARLYCKRLYREFYNDNHGIPAITPSSNQRYGDIVKISDTYYLSGTKYKDVNITIGDSDIPLKKVRIQARAFNASTSATVTLKIYDSTRATLLATSDNVIIEANSAMQKREFILPLITLLASTTYIFAFESTGLWAVNQSGVAPKNYGKFTINNAYEDNTTPPATALNAYFGMVLVPAVGTQNIFVNNIPERYRFFPELTSVNQDGVINILDDRNRLLLNFYAEPGQEFNYSE